MQVEQQGQEGVYIPKAHSSFLHSNPLPSQTFQSRLSSQDLLVLLDSKMS